jgi:hypothetical protein
VTSLASTNVGGGTAGQADTGDTFSVTFNNALNPATVATGSTQTVTLVGNSNSSTTITFSGLSANPGLTVGTTYEKKNNTTVINGSLSLSNGNKTVTFTVTGAPDGNVRQGAAATFTYSSLATLADVNGSSGAPAFNQASNLLLF